MTTKGEWVAYTGSDEQIVACDTAKCGFIVRYKDLTESPILHNCFPAFDFEITHYCIIPEDPLREMKIRQSMTGQPVWVRTYKFVDADGYDQVIEVTTAPDWNIPNAEYRFTPFED